MRADITIDECGRGTVHLDGHDVGNDICGLTLTAKVNESTRLELNVLPDGVDASGEVTVDIPPGAAALLERIGWTPPTGQTTGQRGS